MAPKSLVELCTRAAVKNISVINSIGDMPYHLVRPILLKVESASQLHDIEVNCPHIVDDAVELWRRLIKRDFSQMAEERRYVPKNSRSWHKVYFKYKREHDTQLAAAEARMAEQFDKLKRERAGKETIILKPSEVPMSMRQSTVTGGGAWGRRGGGGDGNNGSSLTWGGGSRTKVTSGQSVMRKVRRETAEVSHRNAIATPFGSRPTSRLACAPKSMINHHRISHNRDVLVDSKVIPPSADRTLAGGVLANGRSEREARLIRAQQDRSGGGGGKEVAIPRLSRPNVHKAAVVVSDEDADDEVPGFDSNGGDGLFGPSPPIPTPSPARQAKRPADASKRPILDAKPPSSLRRAGDAASLQLATKPARTQASPPPGRLAAPPSRSPPAQATTTPSGASPLLIRKRKAPAVDIFMRPKRPAR